jgi:GlpG protein
MSGYGYYSPIAIWSGKYWALITSVFVHRELLHFAFNLYWLWVLGGALERVIGPLRLLAFFAMSAVVSSGVEFAVSETTGIGASGVVYAMFGFMWIARDRVEVFKKAIPKQIVVLFLGWGILCIVATLLKIKSIANAAHIAGLLFGIGVAFLFVLKKRVPLAVAGLASLVLLAIIPLFWCPWSAAWVSKQGYDSHARHDYARAVGWYQRSIELGGDRVWALRNMARAYSSMGNHQKFAEALEDLRQVDPKAAQEIELNVADPAESK